MPRRSRLLAAVVAAALLAPAAAARAATWTVDPQNGSASCASNTCRTIGQAAAKAGDGDTVKILAGTFQEAPVTFDAESVTVEGAGQGTSIVTTGPGNTLSFTGANARLSGVTVAQAVAADGAAVSAAGGLALADALLVSTTGPALVLTGGASRITRAMAISTASAAGGDGLRVVSAATSAEPKQVIVDSSILVGGGQGAGVAVTSPAGALGSSAGDVTVALRHATLSGGHGLLLDASAANGPTLPSPDPAANMAATVSDSIVHGPSEALANPGGGLPATAANTATIGWQGANDGPPPAGSGHSGAPTSNTPDAAVFANPARLNYALRADAPVIDRGGDPPAGDSTQDVNGEPRKAGARTDLGADEFVNRPPVAAIAVSDRAPDRGAAIAVQAGAADPEAATGGGIAEYRWDFGDGVTQATAEPAVQHAFARTGEFRIAGAVVDRQGGVGLSAPVTVAVRDQSAPRLAITAPKSGQVVRLRRRRGRPRPLTVLGTVQDDSGVRGVEVALTRRSRGRCHRLSGRRLRRGSCSRHVFQRARVRGTAWGFATPSRLRLPAGRYELRVRATDTTGISSGVPSTADRTLIRFRIR